MQEAVYTFMKKAIEEQAAKDGVEIVWVSADNNEQKQLNDVQNLVSQKVNAMILHAVNTGAAANLVSQAKSAKIPVIAMDRLPENTKDVALYVTADSKKVGQTQAEFIAKQLNGKGKVIILEGEAGNGVARDITAGNKEVLSKYKEIQIVASQAHQNWSGEAAMNTVTNILTKEKNDIQAILANNTGMAMGAVQALKAAKLNGKVLVIGSDADLNGLQSILAGDGLTADIDKKPVTLGLEAYKAAVAAAKGEKLQGDTTTENGVPVKLTPIELITKENVMTMTYRWPELKK
jgi:D-xylose transport system substrate-binding protein